MFTHDGVRTMNGRFTQYPECTLGTVSGQTLVKEVYEMSAAYKDYFNIEKIGWHASRQAILNRR
jgi:hypothetical protein